MSEQVNKLLGWIVKVAGLIICAPVTFLVAGQLFGDIQVEALRLIVQLAAVLLVEGVLLSNWLLLEFDRNAAPEIKTRYALTALGMYAGLWILAWQHGEGPAGLVFRAALGAALIGSGWDTYVTTWQKITARADRDATTDRGVKGHRRKLAIRDAKESASVDFEILREERELQKVVKLEEIRAHKDRALKGVQLEHKRELRKLAGEFSDLETPRRSDQGGPKRGGSYPYPVGKINQRRRMEKSERLEAFGAHLVEHPEKGPTALVEWAVEAFGVAESTAWEDLKRLRPEQGSNGNGRHQ
jgi:hypothetical protein